MLFNTIDFVIFFITVVTVLVAIKNRKFQHLFLLGASYFFFYYSSNYLITLLIYTTIWDYYFGKAIWKSTDARKKRLLLITSLAGNLGLLGFFKYSDFAITQFNILGNYFDLGAQIPLLNIALPIGISFYTFHSITYTVGIYRKHFPPAESFVDYAIFVAFFPQLVAGPILRAKEFLPQLREKIEETGVGTKLRQILIHNSNLKMGITLMALGFLKKMFFADNISTLVNAIFSNPLGLDSFTIILGTIGFGIQIYCDFSGYTDIAIGAAMIMGFKIPANFNKPFFARSPSDFWKKWHISLSTWVRDYLYLPLAFKNRKSNLTVFSSLMVTFFLLGLWHGAGWNYVIFGVLHGIYVSSYTLIRKKVSSKKLNSFFTTKLGIIFSILVTQYLVFLAFITFRVKDIEHMSYSLQKYVMIDFRTIDTMAFISNYKFPFMIMIIFVILHFISYRKVNLPEQISKYGLVKWTIFLTSVMLIIFFTFDGSKPAFIYFQF